MLLLVTLFSMVSSAVQFEEETKENLCENLRQKYPDYLVCEIWPSYLSCLEPGVLIIPMRLAKMIGGVKK